eukprot:2612664-Pyramimonas_sp.AAC.1
MASVPLKGTVPSISEPVKVLACTDGRTDEGSNPASPTKGAEAQVRTRREIRQVDEDTSAKDLEEQEEGFELPPRLVLDGAPACEATSPLNYSSQEEDMADCEENKMQADRKSGPRVGRCPFRCSFVLRRA